MYNSVKKTKAIRRYTEYLVLHNGVPTVHFEDNNICISVVEYKIVTPVFKHIEIPVCFLQEKFEDDFFFKR